MSRMAYHASNASITARSKAAVGVTSVTLGVAMPTKPGQPRADAMACEGPTHFFCHGRNAQGFQRGDFPWRWSFCAWSLAPPSPETLVIEDATLDARCDFRAVCNAQLSAYCP